MHHIVKHPYKVMLTCQCKYNFATNTHSYWEMDMHVGRDSISDPQAHTVNMLYVPDS